MNRREFFKQTMARLALMAPVLAAAASRFNARMTWHPAMRLCGYRFHAYPQVTAGYADWVTRFGKVVGFVPSK